MLRRAYTQCRFGQMHYLEGIPEDASSITAPTLILLHQNPSSSFEYRELVAEMARDRRVVAFDTPGYGMSDAPPAPPGMASYADAFSDAIDAMALGGPLDVYGFHTGTLLAAELAISRADIVGRVAMTGIPMFSPAECAERLAAALAVPEPDEEGEATMALLRNLWDYAVRQRDPRMPLDQAVLAFSDKSRVLHRFTWAYQGVWAYDFERLRLVTQPTLLAQTHEDLLEVSKAAAALMPDSRVIELPDLDRDIFAVGVDQVAATLRRFFTPPT